MTNEEIRITKETLSGMMTDDEAIENLEYLKEMHGAYPNEVEACDRGIEAIKEKQRWIPVSERLPEHNMSVLITVRRYDDEIVVRSGYYYAHGDNSIFHADNGNCWKINDDGLLAWQPLPEPYKAESEDVE